MPINYGKKKNTNTTFGGTDSIVVPVGTTGQRVGTEVGQLRYNTDIGALESYSPSGWAGIEPPPVVSSTSGSFNEDTDTTITINGSNFQSGATVTFINYLSSSVIGTSPVVTFVNTSQITATTGTTSSPIPQGTQISVKVTNPSGLSAQADNQFTVSQDAVWVTSGGSLGTFTIGGAVSIPLSASGGSSYSYSLASGTLPTGVTISGTNLSGTAPSVGSNTTYNFSLRVTPDGAPERAEDRAFSITVEAARLYRVKAWGAGGSGQANYWGGNGGFMDATIKVPVGTTFGVVVGQGGTCDSPNGNGNAGSGGGLTGIFTGTGALTFGGGQTTNTSSQQRSVLIAGGGGGAGSSFDGGGGGGETAVNGSLFVQGSGGGAGDNGGGPGDQSGGGTWRGGQNYFGADHYGGALAGGWGTGGNLTGYGYPDGRYGGGGRGYGQTGTNGGGGGGGYYGGGGGASAGSQGNSGGGGGGSSYPRTNLSNANANGWVQTIHTNGQGSPGTVPGSGETSYGNDANGRPIGLGWGNNNTSQGNSTSFVGADGRLVLTNPDSGSIIQTFNYSGSLQTFTVP